MKSQARMNRPYMTLPWPYMPGSKWKRRKGKYLKGKPWAASSKENRTRANRAERRKPIETED